MSSIMGVQSRLNANPKIRVPIEGRAPATLSKGLPAPQVGGTPASDHDGAAGGWNHNGWRDANEETCLYTLMLGCRLAPRSGLGSRAKVLSSRSSTVAMTPSVGASRRC